VLLHYEGKRNKKSYRPFKYKFYLNVHMTKIHCMYFFEIKIWPKIINIIKKSKKKSRGCKSKIHEFQTYNKFIEGCKNFFRRS
jgi:hypothetical protein